MLLLILNLQTSGTTLDLQWQKLRLWVAKQISVGKGDVAAKPITKIACPKLHEQQSNKNTKNIPTHFER